MVEPITMMIAAQGLASGLDILGGSREKAFNEAITDAQVQNFNDLIEEQKLDNARDRLAIEGAGSAKAAISGFQNSGSMLTNTGQDIFNRQLKSLRSIRDLKFKRYMAELQGGARNDQITQQQIGAGIKGIGSAVKTANTQGDLEGDAEA